MVSEICMQSIILFSGYVSISALLYSITIFYSFAYFSPAQNFQLRTETSLMFMKAYSSFYQVRLWIWLSSGQKYFLPIMNYDNVYPKFTLASVIDQLGSIKNNYYAHIFLWPIYG
jgi:hypothetical protein